ncbi:hypothetical protein [Methylobacterium sp. B4]|uniref:hypothetical protein n=1 Tax=Methylobacterium sp. B4 TaxID=1938755 RepID=UPI000D755C2C|nr:hypothetical protein [Methylobacterium sp. B4]PXW55003.1 hypothetical protein BY998_11912 [Methylobacterium sp. B4]
MASPINPTIHSKDAGPYRGSGKLDFREMLGMKTGRDYADAETHRFKKARLAAQVEALKKR